MQNHFLKHIWFDYRAELEFGVMVTAVLMLSYWATGVVIPAELSEHWLWPLLNACIATLCFFGAWLCFKHNDDNRIRIAWAVALLLWGLLEAVLVTGVILYDIPIVIRYTYRQTRYGNLDRQCDDRGLFVRVDIVYLSP